jgi:hypothetical protein
MQILPPGFAERKRKYRDHRMPPASGRGAKRGDTSQLKPAHPVNGEVHNFLPHEDFFGDAAAITSRPNSEPGIRYQLGYRQHSLGLPRGEQEIRRSAFPAGRAEIDDRIIWLSVTPLFSALRLS